MSKLKEVSDLCLYNFGLNSIFAIDASLTRNWMIMRSIPSMNYPLPQLIRFGFYKSGTTDFLAFLISFVFHIHAFIFYLILNVSDFFLFNSCFTVYTCMLAN